MRTNSIIRSKRNSEPTIPFLFYAKENLMDRVRRMAYANDMSVAQFLRQSAERNLIRYEKVTEQ